MNTTMDYNLQADKFLAATNTKFSCNYWKHDYYFPDDKEQRDIWHMTLKNDKHRYRFQFGQSIANAGKAPSPYDVLACIQKYEVGTFADHLFGYYPHYFCLYT